VVPEVGIEPTLPDGNGILSRSSLIQVADEWARTDVFWRESENRGSRQKTFLPSEGASFLPVHQRGVLRTGLQDRPAYARLACNVSGEVDVVAEPVFTSLLEQSHQRAALSAARVFRLMMTMMP
jgi:hypothetical protein